MTWNSITFPSVFFKQLFIFFTEFRCAWAFDEWNRISLCSSQSVTMFSMFKVERFSQKKFFFRVQKIGWKFIGFWPGSDKFSSFISIHVILNCLEVLIYAAFQLAFCFVNRGNLVVLLDALTPVATQIVSAVKALVILWRRKDIKETLDYLRDSFYSGM